MTVTKTQVLCLLVGLNIGSCWSIRTLSNKVETLQHDLQAVRQDIQTARVEAAHASQFAEQWERRKSEADSRLTDLEHWFADLQAHVAPGTFAKHVPDPGEY